MRPKFSTELALFFSMKDPLHRIEKPTKVALCDNWIILSYRRVEFERFRSILGVIE